MGTNHRNFYVQKLPELTIFVISKIFGLSRSPRRLIGIRAAFDRYLISLAINGCATFRKTLNLTVLMNCLESWLASGLMREASQNSMTQLNRVTSRNASIAQLL